jgi:branched-chain amino acid transport system substrate-binding protein
MTATRTSGDSSRRRRQGSRPWKAAAFAAAALCLALVAACSSSSSAANSGSAPAGSAGTGTAASGSPINVGAVETASGSYGDPLWLTITNVWVKWTNAHGGINGHPVNLIAVDDAGNPAQGLSEVKKLVQQNHVIAVIGSEAASQSSWVPYLEQQHIPAIGGSAGGSNLGGYSNTFPASLSVSSLLTASFQLAKLTGNAKVGQFMALGAGQNMSQYEGALQQAAKAAGANIVYASAVSPTAPDFTAPCLSLKNAGANMAIVGISPSVTLNIIKTCLQQGYKGAFMTTAGLLTPGWDKDASLNGTKVYVLDDVWPFYQQSTSAQQEYSQAIQQYSPGMLTNPGYNAYVQDAWTGMQMFKTAAQAAKIGPNSTSADLLNGLYALHNETLGGLIGPVTYSKSAKSQVANCYFVSLLSSGQWTEPLGTKAQCVAS